MRLILGEHDITMRPGEAAEFDTQLPRWFGPAGDELVEILSVHGSRSADARPRSAAPHAPADLNIPVRRTANRREARLPKTATELGVLTLQRDPPQGPGMNATPDRARSRCYGGGSAAVATTGVCGVGSG
jgi:hypothetical protein